jgi:SpoIID/LytB domain protein
VAGGLGTGSLITAVVVSGALGWASGPAAAAPRPAFSGTVTVVGHGWGHGIGMGQWGSLGYAIGQDGGLGPQTYQWIVDHYYGPATLSTNTGDPTDAQNVSVALTENNGLNPIVTGNGGLVNVPGTTATAPAVLMEPDVRGGWDIYAGAGCAGPTWTLEAIEQPSGATEVANVAGGTATVQLCLVGGNKTVHGGIEAVENSLGAERTVNIVNLGQYLSDVVPSESPAGWADLGGAGPQGQDWGFQALEAQAVAARSYVLSTPLGYGGYADTCDQTCQSYPGTLNEGAAGGIAGLAVADTAGQVMKFASGAVAVTEYSSSTGGYTSSAAESSPFTPVVDAGDAVCVPGGCNTNHDWTAQVPVSTIDATWPAIGTLEAIAITRRNGYGDYGGRVTAISLTGSGGTVALTGIQFAIDLGLNSDWFAIPGASDVGGGPSGGVGGYWLAAADGGIFAFGDAPFYGSIGGRPLNAPIVALAPTGNHRGYWEVASDGGIFNFGDAPFDGSMGGQPLNQPVVGMAADPATGGYWEVARDGGIFSFDAPFYGSMGGQPLNQPIVGMAPTPDAKGYWLVAADGGIFSFGDATFYGSTGNRALNQPIVGMAPTPDAKGYWLVAADGGIFTFGDAPFDGSGAGGADPGTVAVVPTVDGHGYLIVTGAGQVTSYGDAPSLGDLTTVLTAYSGHVVGAAAVPG